MQSSTMKKFGLAAAAFATALGMSSGAQAMDNGCYARDVVLSTLENEGQYQVISGREAKIGSPKTMFTTNEERTLGYHVTAGIASEANLLCVFKLGQIRLNDNPQLARPSWASFGANTPHDQYLDRKEAKENDRVLLGARAIVRKPNGTEIVGPFFMVTRGNPTPGTQHISEGEATITTNRGGITTIAMFSNIEKTDDFARIAARPTQTAYADPAVTRVRSPN